MRTFKIIDASVHIDNVGTDHQRQELLNETALYYSTKKSAANTNDGCWRYEITYQSDEWLKEAIFKRVHELIKHYMEIDPAYASRFQPHGLEIESWTNVNNPGSSNRLHSHKAFDFVALYYIQGEGTGGLTFHNPANYLVDCSLNSPFVSRNVYEPKDGDLLIWPAWIPHEVEVNQSDKQRINIAFNIRL